MTRLKNRRALLLGMIAAAAFGLALPVRSESVSAISDPAIAKLVADLESGNRQAVADRIASVESLSGLPKQIQNGGELFDRLKPCSVKAVRELPNMTMTEVLWSCPDGTHKTLFDAKYSPPYVVVGEYQDAARLTQQVSRPQPAPPKATVRRVVVSAVPATPPPPDPAVLRELETAVRTGKLKPVAARLRADASVSLGRRDAMHSVTLKEFDGLGMPGLRAAVTAAQKRLGKPKIGACRVEQFFVFCTWDYQPADRRLMAIVHIRASEIRSIELMWATRATALKDLEQR